jgi:S-layer protein
LFKLLKERKMAFGITESGVVYANLGLKGLGLSATNYSAAVTSATGNGVRAYANSAVSTAQAALSESAFATAILTNLGVTAATIGQAAFDALQPAVAGYLNSVGKANYGVVAVQLAQALSALTADATYGAAAKQLNNAAASAYAYGTTAANTTDKVINVATEAAPVTTFVLTTSADNILGTSGNDVFTASVSSTAANSTLNSGDIIVDSSNTDNDTLNIASTAATIDTSSATIAGIENVNANFTTFGTGVVNASGIKTGTLTLNQLQAGANGNATANGTVGSLTIKGGTNVTGTLTVDNITAGSAVVVDSGSAATVTTTTAGAKGSMTITGGAKTGTVSAVADTIKVTVAKTAATVNIDGVTASKAAAAVVYGESATVANGAAAAVGTLDISSSFAATATKTATATLTTAAAATSYNFSGSNDQELKGSSAFFDGKTITDSSTAKSTLNLTTLAADVDLSKAAVDVVKLSASSATQRTISLADKASINVASDVGANGLIIDAQDNVTNTATAYLKGTLNLELSAAVTTAALTIDGSGASDDGFDNINLNVTTADQTGLALITGSGVVVATGAKALVLGATSTAKSVDASAMTGAVTVNYDNTSDIVTVTTGSGDDTFTNATTAIGTKVTINAGAGKDSFTMMSGAKAAIDGGTDYDKVTLVGDTTALTLTNIEEVALSGAVTSAKASQLNGKSYIMSGAYAWTFGTSASNFDTDTVDLSNLTINDVTGFTIDASNGLAAANYTSVTPVTIIGSSIADTIKGTANGDTLNGGAGNDVITGNDGADVINGGTGTDLIYGDNGGGKEVQTLTITYAAAETDTITVLGTAVTFSAATSATVSAAAAVTAINASAVKDLVTASSSAGVVTLTYKVDGDVAQAAFSGTANSSVDATTTAGTAGTSALDTLTGGTGADTFVFSNGNAGAAPSDAKFDTITDFATNSDVVTYTSNTLSIVTNATATSGVAKVTSAGVATFHADDSTLAKKIVAAEAAIQTGTATAGQMAIFQDGADAYAFISDGTDGVGAGDVLVKLVGVDTTATAFDTVTITGHSFVLA